MRCFYSQDLELELPDGHPFPMDKFRVSKDMLLEGRILRPEEVVEVRAADPHVLRAVGYDPDQVVGFAFGLGIERLCMRRHNITDIREFYTNDVRFLHQF